MDFSGNFILQCKHIIEFAIIFFGPDLLAIVGIDQAGYDTNPVASLTHRTFDHCVDSQQIPNSRQLEVLVAQLVDRLPGDDPELPVNRDRVNQVIGQAIDEVLVVCIGGEILKWQDGQCRDAGVLRCAAIGNLLYFKRNVAVGEQVRSHRYGFIE